MKKALKIILVFAVVFLALTLGTGCDIKEDDDNTFSIWINTSQYYNQYYLSSVKGTYESKGYINKNFTVLDSNNDGAVAKFNFYGSKLSIELFDGMSIATSDWWNYTTNKIKVYGVKSAFSTDYEYVGDLEILKVDGKYKLKFTEKK